MKLYIAGTVAVHLITAAAFDVRHEKIPNILLINLVVIQIVSELISLLLFNEPIFTWTSVFYVLLIILFLYPFFMINELGAGDIKLIAVASMTVKNILLYLVLVFALGAVIAVVRIALKKRNEDGRVVVHLALPVLLAYCLAVIIGM